ncbi:hypothetical protein NON00_16830 [Roseomonas sp. GC11]|uniref:hypothetical protein n=1 Tax=Roseomonas sp. GC11 TaxID=2950546 RepID=UPI00210CCA91|nr:hypothetical protein [Roseomonas sp. GC11]MCQ4161583.1 hypothetical protein [Roseomonas sp. GC11]
MADFYFVLGQKRGRAGSAFLRGEQLSEIVTPTLEEAGFSVKLHFGVSGLENSVCFVNKTALLDHGPEGLRDLRGRGNRIIIDPVDLPIGAKVWDLPDAVVSSSFMQDEWVRDSFPGKPCVYIPHHADLRLLDGSWKGRADICHENSAPPSPPLRNK